MQDEYTASRPYPCDFCPKRFRKKANLINHMTAHQNDRPHVCNLCGARYIRKSDLLNHLRTHAYKEDGYAEDEQDLVDCKYIWKHFKTLFCSRLVRLTQTVSKACMLGSDSNSFPKTVCKPQKKSKYFSQLGKNLKKNLGRSIIFSFQLFGSKH